ncbi:MAG: class I SAM-dependent methyltransferase [Propionibacteriaceae bacterium]|nr:class I SAM-dependent methyltransferase [Propionibacteriaceae bacterium]
MQSRFSVSDFVDGYTDEPNGSAAARARAAELGLAPITPATAAALRFIAKAIQAKNAVEIGTGSGVSALALIAGMAADGVLTSIDPEAESQSAAREVLTAQGIPARRFRLISGLPLSVLPKLADAAYDLVFINSEPLEYVEYVAQADRLLRPGGTLILNHALWGGKVADANNDDDEPLIIREALAAVKDSERHVSALLTVGDGLLVSVAG